MKPRPVTVRALILGILGMLTSALPEARAEEKKIRTIVKDGERVDLEGYLVKGKYTLFEFYADWSPEWRGMAPEIEAKVKKGNDVVLRRINVRSWSSPVVKQYGIPAIPHYRLYDPDGKLMKAYSPDVATEKTSPRRNEPSKRAAPVSASPSRPPTSAVRKVLTIAAKGESVDINKHLVAGKYTLFEFYANW